MGGIDHFKGGFQAAFVVDADFADDERFVLVADFAVADGEFIVGVNGCFLWIKA